MTTISERIHVHCSVNQGAHLLARYFKARGNSDGDVARLNLRAKFPLPGAEDGVKLEHAAIATIVPRHTAGEMMPHYGITWTSEDPGPYPRFAGDLAIESADDFDSFYLALEGNYQPPLGMIGAAFDAALGHRIAQSTAHELLTTIAASIETEFQAVERTKADARTRIVAGLATEATPTC